MENFYPHYQRIHKKTDSSIDTNLKQEYNTISAKPSTSHYRGWATTTAASDGLPRRHPKSVGRLLRGQPLNRDGGDSLCRRRRNGAERAESRSWVFARERVVIGVKIHNLWNLSERG
ncbi:hypothetical protein AAHA92_06370 [Salvia divinorum]|uniref:Uncharacterized protein n=1 Tax=Salvia divinorum TaxID=28513 RepID=A0ABD1I5F5_SALDI